MALPKLVHPQFSTTLTTGKKIRFRPMLGREEKILLIAKQSEDFTDKVAAVKQVVQNCVTDTGFDADTTPSFEIEWLFVQIRINSCDNISRVAYKDRDDGKTRPFEIDLRKVVVLAPEVLDAAGKKQDPKIVDCGGGIKLVMKWPEGHLMNPETMNKADAVEELILACVDKIWQGDTVHDPSLSTRDELIDFMDDLSLDATEKLKTFVASVPHLYYKIEYTNDKGDGRVIELTSLDDFFSF